MCLQPKSDMTRQALHYHHIADNTDTARHRCKGARLFSNSRINVAHQLAVYSVDAYVHNHNALFNHFRLHKAGLAHCSDNNICLL